MTMRSVVAASGAAGLLPLVLVGILGSTTQAPPAHPAPELAKDSASPEVAARFDVERYRREGQSGVDRFYRDHAQALETRDAATLRAFDEVCGQHDCVRTKLFWFTELDAAKAESKRTHKPILSLHLLGRFDEQLTCANSRFFRRILYPDPRINAALREKYVLHWKTVRPVPKITIDFGDGRTMQRTITGNSAHYVLDEDGRPLDVIPGLFSPHPFLAALDDAATLSGSVRGLSDEARAAKIEAWHAAKLEADVKAWREAMKSAGLTPPTNDAPASSTAIYYLEQATKDDDWQRIAAYSPLAGDRAFDLGVRDQLFGKLDAWTSGQVAITKAAIENPMLRAIRTVEWTVHTDSLRNELSLHGRAHEWFAHQRIARTGSVEQLNARVYLELFKAPLNDPWYGLEVPPELRELDGTIVTASAVPAR